MRNFTYNAFTKIIFGKDSEDHLIEQLQIFKATGVLVHYGMGSAVKSGLIAKIRSMLDRSGIKYAELSGVQPNPRLSLVREGIKICKEYNLDFVLAVGGGSVIDSAKAIGVGSANEGNVWDFYTRERVPTSTLPVGVVLTLASAGSESSTSSVIRNEDENTKRSLLSDMIRPVFAILNPVLATNVNKFSLACGVTDIIMHTLDRYFTDEDNAHLTDLISESIISSTMKYGKAILENPNDYNAMANIFWAGSLSHNNLTELGKPRDLSVHALERGISGNYDTAHPAGLSLIWPSWAKYVYKTKIHQFAQYAVRVLNIKPDFKTPEATALAGIEKMTRFFNEIGMPTTFNEAGLSPTQQEMEQIVNYAFVSASQIGTFFKLTKEDAMIILNNARG